ncbi:MAG: HIT family protein [Methanobrevibacter sp.]|jgi:diadenosine tetraphosphate (Ap4A) HIT family hydrolase|nr:HIT family protein [Candidatus Methanoflexus mossambicus]
MKNEIYGNLILETEYWKLFLAPSQRYLGTSVLSLKRECPSLKDLNNDEWEEFIKFVKTIETLYNKLFKPDLFNWGCLKNKSFRDKNPKPEIHWHIHPRYGKSFEFMGVKFEDKEFGYPPSGKEVKIDENVQIAIVNLIKENLVF